MTSKKPNSRNAQTTTRNNERFAYSEMLSLTSEQVRYDLAESVSKDLTLADVLSETDYKQLATTPLAYSNAAGNSELRELLAQRHIGVTADDVVITQGGMHALFLLGQILGTDGQQVLIHQPSFPSTVQAMQTQTISVNTFTSDFQNRYRVNVASVEQLLTESTMLLCLESPRNPSGVCVDTSTINTLLATMSRNCPNAYLVIDETYREASYANAPIIESMIALNDHIPEPRVVITGSLSKSHGAPGLRLGWVITKDKWLREQLVRGKFQTVIANGTLDELLAIRVLQQADNVLTPRREQLGQAKALVADWVEDHAALIDWVEPDAGALCCVALRDDQFDKAAVKRFYDSLKLRGVRVAPGNWFGESEWVFRVGFGYLSLEDTKAALKEVGHALNDAVV